MVSSGIIHVHVLVRVFALSGKGGSGGSVEVVFRRGKGYTDSYMYVMLQNCDKLLLFEDNQAGL